MQVWQNVGTHRYYTDGDVVFWHMVGTMEEAHLDTLLAAVDAILSRFHHSVVLADCSQGHSLRPEARRRYAEWLKHSPDPRRASIFFSARGELRAFLLLAQRGGELASGQHSAIEIVDDEAAARQRVDEIRAIWSKGSVI